MDAWERPDEPLYVSLKPDLTLHLGEDPVARESLGASPDTLTESDRETRIFVRADRGVDYGDVMDVMNLLRDAGYLTIALVGLEKTQAGAPVEDSGASPPDDTAAPAPVAPANRSGPPPPKPAG